MYTKSNSAAATSHWGCDRHPYWRHCNLRGWRHRGHSHAVRRRNRYQVCHGRRCQHQCDDEPDGVLHDAASVRGVDALRWTSVNEVKVTGAVLGLGGLFFLLS